MINPPAPGGEIVVCLASNAAYFHGLLVTVVSTLLHNRQSRLVINVIDGGLRRDQVATLKKICREMHPAHEIQLRPFAQEVFAGFTKDYGGSHMTYARILMGELLDCDRVIYLDSDLLVLCSLAPIWKVPMGENVIAATPCPVVQHLTADCAWELEERYRTAPYFNAGVMLVDLVRWKQLQAQTEVLKLINQDPKKCRFWDQTALNYLFRGKVTWLDSKFNRNPSDPACLDGNCIIHYMAPAKPWTIYNPGLADTLWRTVFHRYGGSRAVLLARKSFLSSRIWVGLAELGISRPRLQSIIISGLGLMRRLSKSDLKQRVIDRRIAMVKNATRQEFAGAGQASKTLARSLEASSNEPIL